MKQFKMQHFDNYTLEECGFKILEEAAEVYAVWQNMYKDGCNCSLCDASNVCDANRDLSDELYDVLQVCVNITAMLGGMDGFDGCVIHAAIDKEFMQMFLSYVAYVHVLIKMYDGSTLDRNNINGTVKYVVDRIMEIAYAYGIDMAKTTERGTQRNIVRGRISADKEDE